MPIRLLLTAAVLTLSAAAHAQIVSVYGTFSPVHASGVDSGVNSGSTPGTTSFWAPGVGAGVTFGILPIGPIHIGLDLRGSSKPGNRNGADTALGGLRVGLKLPLLRIKPYVEAAGGYVATRTTIASGPTAGGVLRPQFAAYEVLGGVDYKLLPLLDLRLLEVGGGKGYNAFDSSGSSETISLFTVNTGVVVHF